MPKGEFRSTVHEYLSFPLLLRCKHGLRRYRADGALCRVCPAFGECTTSTNGRSIKVSEYEPELRRQRELLSTEPARSMYKRRQGLVEPVFGLLKEYHGARRFLLRGRESVLSEWCLLAAAFNLKSLHRVWSAASPSNPPQVSSPRIRPRCGRGANEVTRTHLVPRRTARTWLATRRIYPVYRSSPITRFTWPHSRYTSSNYETASTGEGVTCRPPIGSGLPVGSCTGRA